MKIRYDLQLDDLLAFARYYSANSSSHRTARLVRTCVVAFFVGLLAIVMLIQRSFEPLMMGGTFLAIFAALTVAGRALQGRYLRRAVSDSAGRGGIGPQVLEMTAEGIQSRDAVSESLTRWAAIQDVALTDRHASSCFRRVERSLCLAPAFLRRHLRGSLGRCDTECA